MKKWRNTFEPAEGGFTLQELLIVVIILSILTSLATPLLAGARRAAVEASLKSDLSNAGLAMQNAAVHNGGIYPTTLPSYTTTSRGNMLGVDLSKSNGDYFCLTGANQTYSDMNWTYSAQGGLSSTGCPAVPAGTSFGAQNAASQSLSNKKALIVSYSGNEGATSAVTSALKGYGYGQVDNVYDTDFVNMSDYTISQYDLVFVEYYYWAAKAPVTNKITIYYNNGGKVIQDGNDTDQVSTLSQPFAGTSVTFRDGSGGYYYPTNAAMTPAFPAWTAAPAWGADNPWTCITSTVNGATVLATYTYQGSTCDMMFAATNSSNGRWLFIDWVRTVNSPTQAALTWLNE